MWLFSLQDSTASFPELPLTSPPTKAYNTPFIDLEICYLGHVLLMSIVVVSHPPPSVYIKSDLHCTSFHFQILNETLTWAIRWIVGNL